MCATDVADKEDGSTASECDIFQLLLVAKDVTLEKRGRG